MATAFEQDMPFDRLTEVSGGLPEADEDGEEEVEEEDEKDDFYDDEEHEWYEKKDPKSGRPYYVNRKTKETTWEKPIALQGKHVLRDLVRGIRDKLTERGETLHSVFLKIDDDRSGTLEKEEVRSFFRKDKRCDKLVKAFPILKPMMNAKAFARDFELMLKIAFENRKADGSVAIVEARKVKSSKRVKKKREKLEGEEASDEEVDELEAQRGIGVSFRAFETFIRGKIENQRTLLRRNHPSTPTEALADLKNATEAVGHATSLAELLGIEGNAARIYFRNFQK